DLPAAIDRVLGRCLAKSPDARWQSAADLASELRWLREAPAPTTRANGASPSPSRAYAAVLAVVVSAVGAVALTTTWFADRERAASRPMYRFPVVPAEDTRYAGL